MQTVFAVFEVNIGPEKLLIHMNEKLYQVKHQWDTARHSNADYELHLILRGSCELDVEDRLHRLREGQAVIIAPGQYHHSVQRPGEFEHFSVSFSLGEGPLLSLLRSAVPDCRICNVTPDITNLCRGIFYESAAGNPFRREMMHAQLTQLMLSSFRLLNLSAEARPAAETVPNSSRTYLIDNFFEAHLADKAGEEELAALLHLSRRQLSRVLKENYGMGYREKLLRTRMDCAAWMLRCTDRKISQIANEVGYTSEAAFYQVFRTRFEMTPTEYRSQYKKTDKQD